MIKLEKAVYEKIWTGEVDQILSYDEQEGFTVKDIATGKKRKHGTSLDCLKISFDPKNFIRADDECIQYVINSGIKHLNRVPSRFLELLNNTTEDFNKLIGMLKRINSGEIKVETVLETDHNVYIKSDSGNEISTIESLACATLISVGGQCHWDNIQKLKTEGFDVFAGESDSFGWLTGCIRTSKGIIIYG